MENKKHSQQFLRKRKFFLIMPLLVLPALTMFFWALGGGRGNNTEAESIHKQSGLNLKLPDAKLKSEKGFDKLSFYKQAALDSQKIFKERKLDPYWNKYSLSNKKDDDPFHLNQTDLHGNLFSDSKMRNSLNNNGDMDQNEAKVYSKLEQLNARLKSTEVNVHTKKFNSNTPKTNIPSRDIDRLEQMMHAMKENTDDDPQMHQLNNILDKIIAAQHPESIADTTYSPPQKNSSYQVSLSREEPKISLIESHIKENGNENSFPHVAENHNSFYSLDDAANDIEQENAIKAIIPETQTIVTGSTVKLLLLNNISVNGITVPKNRYVFGIASLNNERLKITVSSIQYQNNILPVSLDVYDLDGLAGIYVPGSISRDVAKQSTDQAVNGIGITTLNPSLAAQATSAGIQAAKTLISKKVKLVKVTVKAGYQVLLTNGNQKQ